MSNLIKTSTRLLGKRDDFERESYLEGFIYTNPLILASSEDCPENLIPVYIIGRQKMCKIKKSEKGITDLICLIWDPNMEKYEIWIYELKVKSNNLKDIEQLDGYLNAIESPLSKDKREELIKEAKEIVGEELIEDGAKIRGALCAQAFSEEVISKLIEINSNLPSNEERLAVKINRYPVDNDVFVLVDPLIGGEQASIGGHTTYYDEIPEFSFDKLKQELRKILQKRKSRYPERFKQLKAFLEIFIKDPELKLTQNEMREIWEQEGLKREDRGVSVSQLFGYKRNGALRQLFSWDIKGTDMKENYQLRDKNYSELIDEVLQEF